jgi:hypothetical protein
MKSQRKNEMRNGAQTNKALTKQLAGLEMRNGAQTNKALTKQLAGLEILGWPAGKNQVIAKHQAQTE